MKQALTSIGTGAVILTIMARNFIGFWLPLIGGAIMGYFGYRTTALCIFGLAFWNLIVGNLVASWIDAARAAQRC
jgi:hypothetical protein